MVFDKTLLTEDGVVVVGRTTWNASATKSRLTYRLSMDNGATFKGVTRVEACFILGKTRG